jgi:ferredoxin
MKNVSKNKCVGCGICESICPEGMEVVDGIARVKYNKADCLEKALKACPQKAIKEIEQDLLFAVGTDDYKTIKSDDHFGMSKHYLIYQYSKGNLIFKERRNNFKYKEEEERVHGDPGKAKATSYVLADIDVLVGKMFGPNIVRLKNKYVCAVIREPEIKKATEIIKENINEIIDEKDKKERKGILLN